MGNKERHGTMDLCLETWDGGPGDLMDRGLSP